MITITLGVGCCYSRFIHEENETFLVALVDRLAATKPLFLGVRTVCNVTSPLLPPGVMSSLPRRCSDPGAYSGSNHVPEEIDV